MVDHQIIEKWKTEANLLNRLASGMEQGLDLEMAKEIYDENSPFQ